MVTVAAVRREFGADVKLPHDEQAYENGYRDALRELMAELMAMDEAGEFGECCANPDCRACTVLQHVALTVEAAGK